MGKLWEVSLTMFWKWCSVQASTLGLSLTMFSRRRTVLVTRSRSHSNQLALATVCALETPSCKSRSCRRRQDNGQRSVAQWLHSIHLSINPFIRLSIVSLFEFLKNSLKSSKLHDQIIGLQNCAWNLCICNFELLIMYRSCRRESNRRQQSVFVFFHLFVWLCRLHFPATHFAHDDVNRSTACV